MSLKERGIARPRDLVGKTVGYPGIPSQEAFLATMLESDGAQLSDVTLINVGFNLVPAVISGRVDAVMGAYWTHETILAEREGHQVSLMRVEDWGVPDYYELVLVASETMIASRPGVIRSLLKAVQRGYEDAINDPGAALEALSRAYEGVDREVEQQGIALLIPVWTDGGLIFGTQAPERWEAYAGWMKERKLIPEDLDVSKAFTTAFLPGAVGTPVAT
jgi:putative hydroxymethylpyrimidine transport system substrate-binding protein